MFQNALLRNAPLSSIYIHFGVELLAFEAPLTSVSLSKHRFLTDKEPRPQSGLSHFYYQSEPLMIMVNTANRIKKAKLNAENNSI